MAKLDLRANCSNPIVRGANWSQLLQYGTGYQAIASSTAGSPAVISLLDLQASFANGTKIVIGGHDNEPLNNSLTNPYWTVAGSSNNTFNVGVNGVNGVLGTQLGYAFPAIDATGWTGYVMLLPDTLSLTPIVLFTNLAGTLPTTILDIYTTTGVTSGTFAWNSAVSMQFTISLTHAQTALLAEQKLYGRAFFVDASGNPQFDFRFTVPVVNG